MSNLYAGLEARDPMALDDAGDHYTKHVMAMTAEKLHSKADIAAELGYRDMRLAELEAELAELREAMTEKCERLTFERDQSVRRVDEVNKYRRQEQQAYEGEIEEHKAHNGRVIANNEELEKDLEMWVAAAKGAGKYIQELEQQLSDMREAADKYSGFGHHEICQAIPDYNIKCICGLAELEALITPADTTPGPAPESSQEAPEKT